MASFSADLVVRTLGKLDPSFNKVITKLEQVSDLVNTLNKKPLNIFGQSAGIGGDIAAKQLKGFQDAVRNVANSADDAAVRARLLGNTVATTGEKADVFAQALENVKLKSNGLKAQDAAVKTLARAWAIATQQATTYSERLELIQSDALREAGVQPKGQSTLLNSDEALQARAAYDSRLLVEREITKQKNQQAFLDERAARTAERIARIQDTARKKQRRKQNLQLGVGFPLLFGGGPGSVAGGALGALSDDGGGFGGQVLFSAIGTQIDEAIKRARDFGRAIQDIDARALNDALGNVSSQLVIQVDLLKEQGKLVEARALLEKEVAEKTGLAGGASQNIANSVGILESGFKELVNAASGLLGIIGAPFAALIGGILSLVGKAVALVNTLLSGVGKIVERAGRIAIEFLFGKDAANKLDDAIAGMNERLDDSVIKASELGRELAKTAKDLAAEVVLEGTRSPYDDLAGKIANIRVDAAEEFRKIQKDYENTLKRVNALPEDTVEERVVKEQQKLDAKSARTSKEQLAQQKFEQQIQKAKTQDLKDQNKELEKQAGIVRKIEDARIAADLAKRVRELQLIPDSKPFSRELSPEEVEVNKTELQRAKNSAAIAKIKNSNLNITEQELRLAEQAEKNQLALNVITGQATVQIRERKEAQMELNEGAKLELDLALAKTDRAKFYLQLASEIRDLERSNLDLTEDQIDAYKKLKIATFEALNPSPLEAYRQQLEQTLYGVDAVEKQIVSMTQTVANELGTGLSNAITGLVDGTKSVEEAFSDMFAGIGKAFIDMGTKMIAQALAMKAVGILSSIFGGGAGFQSPGASPGGAAGVAGIGGGGLGDVFGNTRLFSGGGYTGDAPRTGGVDGRGGFPAILHPQETVIDHTGAMSRYSGGNASTALAMAPMAANVTYNGPTLNFEGDKYIPRSEADALVAAGAKQGQARALNTLKNSRSQRAKLGM